MNINLVAGGPENLIPDLSEYREKDTLWIGVDRGAVTLLDSGIVPDEAFGDFDSITTEQKKRLKKPPPASTSIKPRRTRQIWTSPSAGQSSSGPPPSGCSASQEAGQTIFSEICSFFTRRSNIM